MKLYALIKIATKIMEENLPTETGYQKFMKDNLLDRIKNHKGTLTSDEERLKDNLILNKKTQPSHTLDRFLTSRTGAFGTGFFVPLPLAATGAALTAHLTRQSYARKAMEPKSKKKK